MSNRNHEQSDINELTKLTPFGIDVYQQRSKFSAGHLFVTTHILESATPLKPWSSGDNELESVTQVSL